MNISEKPQWETEIKLLERLDKVEGGRDGAANIQAGQLANRTRYLRDQLDAYNTLLKSGELPFTNEVAAKAAIIAGRIPEGAVFSVRSDNPAFWVEEFRNMGGEPASTGKFITSSLMTLPLIEPTAGDDDGTTVGIAATLEGQYFLVLEPSSSDSAVNLYRNVNGQAIFTSGLASTGAVEDMRENITQLPLYDDVMVLIDELGFSHSRFMADGGIITPAVKLLPDEMTSGNISVRNLPRFDSNKLMLSDELGFSVPATEGSENGNVDPGEVTVDLPPQTAAYGLLSKMRAALEDVCIIINSDSTGITQDTDPVNGVFKKWTRKLVEFLAANYPAYTVNYYTWSAGAYVGPETIQVGTAGKTLHFYNAAIAGTQPLYLMGRYFEAAYVPRQADLIIYNHGHNTDYNVNAGVQAGMNLSAMYQMLQRHPNAGAIMVSQNPLRDSNLGASRSTGARQAAIAAGFSLVDVYQLFMATGKPVDWYLDNVHPNATGDEKIFGLVKNLFTWPATPAKYTAGLLYGGGLVPNADFSSWDDDAGVPDGWTLTGCTAEEDTVNFESGICGLRLISTGSGSAYASRSLPASLVRRLRGQTIVVGCRVYVPVENTRANAGYISIEGISGSRGYGIPAPGGRGGFVWKASVVTVPVNADALTIIAGLDTSGGAAGNVCTFDRITLTVGSIPQDFI
ncbi:TPA: SGNH/GDSL hydrolase family protein [Klebsiella pneumoniae]